MSDVVLLGATFALLAVNACFVAGEFAVVTVRRNRVEAMAKVGGVRARILKRVLDDLEAHLSCGQLVVTAATLGIGWLSTPVVARLIAPLIADSASEGVAHAAALSAAFLLAVVITLALGEITPKLLGLRRTESVALWAALPLYGAARLTKRPVSLLTRMVSGLLSLIGLREPDYESEGMDPDEVRAVLSHSAATGRLSLAKRRMIENVIDFSHHTAKQIMVPRDDIAFLSLENSLEQNLAVIHSTEYTRYPLCESGLDTVVGMIHLKDLFNRSSSLQTSEDLRLLQHEMLMVPEAQAIDALQSTFQTKRAHMAMVVDEYGVPTGLVTLEDVLEELVGEIRDEFDEDEKPKIVPSSAGMLVDGMLLVDELCRELQIELEERDNDTVGGYVTTELGKIAHVGDRFTLGSYQGRVVEMRGRRIARVLLAEPAAG